jgi:hypothetical protein
MENNQILSEAVPREQLGIKNSEYRPSKAQVLREYDINISFLDRGCIVKVGCKSIAFMSVESAMEAINDYVADPYEQQTQWIEALGK